MIFTKAEMTKIKRCLDVFMNKHRPPEFVRDDVDLIYTINNNDIRLFYVRCIDGKIYQQNIVLISYDAPFQQWWLFRWRKSTWYPVCSNIRMTSFSDAIKRVDANIDGYFS